LDVEQWVTDSSAAEQQAEVEPPHEIAPSVPHHHHYQIPSEEAVPLPPGEKSFQAEEMLVPTID
jgi:hypothetical protein